MPPDSDAPGNEPHLELPSLGFRRKKKRDKHADDDGENALGSGPEASTSGGTEQDVPRAPVAPPPPARAPGSGPAPARPAPRPPARPPSRPLTPSSASTAARPKPTPARPPARPAAQPPAARAGTPPTATPPTAQPAAAPQPAPQPAAEPTATAEPSAPIADREADTAVLGEMAAGLDEPRRAKRSSRDQARTERAEAQARKREEKQEAKRAARKEKAGRKQQQREQREAELAARAELEEEPVGGADLDERRSEPAIEADDEGQDDDGARFTPADALVARLPEIKPAYAAVISGLLAGLAAVLLAIGASKGCDAVRDNSSCGGGAGLLAIVAILAIEVLIGANLLKAWQISDPFSTSFLGVGVVATIAMLTFLDSLDSVWMLLVIPLMTAVAFVLSWWVTVRFIDEHPMASEIDSERGEPAFDERAADSDRDSNA